MARNKTTLAQHQQHLNEGIKNQDVHANGGTSGEPPAFGMQVITPNSAPKPVYDDSEVKKPRRFRVDVGGYIVVEGMRVPLRVGKIIRETDYPIERLVLQGIQLTELVDPKEKEPEPAPASTNASESTSEEDE